jgi:hypothetical protein
MILTNKLQSEIVKCAQCISIASQENERSPGPIPIKYFRPDVFFDGGKTNLVW